MAVTNATRKYNIIYVYTVPYEDHAGLRKIGKAEVNVEEDYYPTPNDGPMTEAAEERIADQLGTGGFRHTLEYTEVAHYRNEEGKGRSFIDDDVHFVLRNSGFKSHNFGNGIRADEWFEVSLEKAIEAIHAVKEERQSLTAPKHSIPEKEIHFREEQECAINNTLDQFQVGNKMLWNAKMRFGKTLCALEVVHKLDCKRTLILTHRPAVRDGWFKDFKKLKFENYQRGCKPRSEDYMPDDGFGQSFESMEKDLLQDGTHYIYFMSMQDLRGSKETGGKFDKNSAIFTTDWDLVILDEAHEGTQTTLGKAVIKALQKRNPKMLYLSGTPYNILDQFSGNEIYTWDYVKEQQAKEEWPIKHPNEPNPYEGLPRMNIHTYSLGSAFENYKHAENDYFDFREFFRVWTDADKDNGDMPEGAIMGDFVHKEDVRAFLDLMTTDDPDSNYPFANEKFRGYFQHSFWVVPGVKAAAALTTMLEQHPVFKEFAIVNVAGDGGKLASTDIEEEEVEKSREEMEQDADEIKAALGKVRNAIANNSHTITISCGRLTTGVTVPEWTAVLMLAGSYHTKAAIYMQTIFRVQSPAEDGTIKHECYAFDFAPDRTVTVVNDYLDVARKLEEEKSGEEAQKKEKGHYGGAHGKFTKDFLHFCPIISFDGSETKPLDTIPFMTKVHRAIADQIYHKGFNDHRLFQGFDKVTMSDLEFLSGVEKFFGRTTRGTMSNDGEITINDTGLTGENAQQGGDGSAQTRKKPRKKSKTKKKSSYKESLKRYQQLMGAVAKRFPLLLFGAVGNLDAEHWSLQKFVKDMEKSDWEQFMPRGFSQEKFLKMEHLFNNDFFITSTQLLLEDTREADTLPVSERVSKMAHILQRFHYPDKETVLTPWRVVNMHMTQTIGGYSFYSDDKFSRESLDSCLVEQNITRDIFSRDSKILEINSKSGVYPLWLAYTFFRFRCEEKGGQLTREQEQAIWDDVVSNQLFVLCKTEMAERITDRVLRGYRTEVPTRCQHEPDLLKILKDEELKQRLTKRLKKYSYWGIKNMEPNKFNFKAVVGNPPYQVVNKGDGTGADPIYNYFIDLSKGVSHQGSLIHPGRFLFNAGKTPKDWNAKMLSDPHFKVVRYYSNSGEVFPTVDIKGGIAITYWNEREEFTPIGFFTVYPTLKSIVEKVKRDNFSPLSQIVYPRDLYHLTDALYAENTWAEGRQSEGHKYDVGSGVFDVIPELFYEERPNDGKDYSLIYGRENNERVLKWIRTDYLKYPDNLHSYKVFVAKTNGSGTLGEPLSMPIIGEPNVGHTVTFLSIGKFTTEIEAQALLKYIQTKFARTLLGTLKVTQDNPKETWSNIPLQDFISNSDIDWSKPIEEIGKQLYAKYNLSTEEIAFIEKMIKPME